MRSHRWKSPLEQAGRLRRITAGWLRGEGIPPDLYLPGDTVIVETRRQIRPGETVVPEVSRPEVPSPEIRREAAVDSRNARADSYEARADSDNAVPLHQGVREAIYLHTPGAAAIRFVSPNPDAVSLQIPASDLVIVGVVIGLRRAL